MNDCYFPIEDYYQLRFDPTKSLEAEGIWAEFKEVRKKGGTIWLTDGNEGPVVASLNLSLGEQVKFVPVFIPYSPSV